MNIQPYKIRESSVPAIPLLVSIPHTGTYVPDVIDSEFASDYIRSLPMTDWHLHHLYDFLPALGATTLYATYSRFVADLNRPPDNTPLYPGRFETGFVALQTFWGQDIYRTAPGPEELERRRELVHAPYHARLLELIESMIHTFGRLVLIDAHSVASRSNLVHGELKSQIYLGDRDGRSCASWLVDAADNSFRKAGFDVVRNAPYKGGYITEHYGRMDRVEALQIEMCERVYMDENDPANALERPEFERAKQRIKGVLQELCTEIGVQRAAW